MFECANFPSPPELYQNPPSPPPPPPPEGDEDTGISGGSIYEDFTIHGSGNFISILLSNLINLKYIINRDDSYHK